MSRSLHVGRIWLLLATWLYLGVLTAQTTTAAPAWCDGTVLGLNQGLADLRSTFSRGISTEEGQQFKMHRDGRITAVRALLWAYSEGHVRMSLFRGERRDYRLYYVNRSLSDLPRYGRDAPLEMTMFELPTEIPVLKGEVVSVMFEGQPGDPVRSGAVGGIARGDVLKDSKFAYDERFTSWKGSPDDSVDDWDYLVSVCLK